MNAFAQATSAAPSPSLQARAGQAGSVPLTRVALAFVRQCIDISLRFGEPARTVQLDRWRRCAVFLPVAVFYRMRCEWDGAGTTCWQLMVMQAGTSLDAVQRLPGVRPGARLLLHVEDEQKVREVLARIDAIEVRGIAAIDVSPAYWRTLGNRLAARLPLPDYTAARHAAWLAWRVLR
jgi:hypothetical protein